MRLSKVKLAGFKSFVDPTVITFPSNLVGVVGPNGCGKSNVIDAVRWVMGESSASRLRGDSITDVIFKGSSSRKPVGAATVELIFDNTETSIEGEYAKYNEISIRRVVSRDSISNYYLNGVRCRRKDITGIFLGTGLGPRSYSIIEQGMISRMIEAKPEEMRVFIEEAAGISKYKERRKETSSRIGRTKENLDRLLDVIDEIEKQINHLKRQAKTAERYKKMRQDERRFTADILAIRIRELNQNALKIEKIFMEKKVLLDSRLADQRKIEANIESQRLEHNEKMDLFNKVQANYYKVGSEISRLEQSIEYSTEIEVRQKKELEQAIQNSSEIENHISLDKEQIIDIENVLNTLEPSIINANNSESIAKELLNSAEQAIQAWQRKWDDFKSKENELTQCVTIESNRLLDSEVGLKLINEKQDKLRKEEKSIDTKSLQQKIIHIGEKNKNNLSSKASLEKTLLKLNQEVIDFRKSSNDLVAILDECQNNLRVKEIELFKLTALQNAAYGSQSDDDIKWLKTNGLSKNKRIAQNITITSGWEIAVETVLGDYLEGLCVNGIQQGIEVIKGIKAGRFTMINSAQSKQKTDFNLNSLASKIENAPDAIYSLLENILIADTLDQALDLSESSNIKGSVITKNGVWLSTDWIRVFRGKDDIEAGILPRERKIRSLEKEIKQLVFDCNTSGKDLESMRGNLQKKELKKDQIQNETVEIGNSCLKIKGELDSLVNQLDQLNINQSNSMEEVNNLEAEKSGLEAIIKKSTDNLNEANQSIMKLESLNADLESEKNKLNLELERVRSQFEADRKIAQEMIIQYESKKSTKLSAAQNLERMISQQKHFETRKEEIQKQIELNKQPLIDSRNFLEEQLSEKISAEQDLSNARTVVETMENDLKQSDQARLEKERAVSEARVNLDESKEESQVIKIRREGLVEQLSKTDFSFEELLDEMSDAATLDNFNDQLERISLKINRLGPINLAAIGELETNSERKEYLDSQMEDLNSALSTLESAIRKIDRETRSRFRETFNQVNSGFEKLFPKLFGGGQAYMELIGDDLLSAGVSVMARPPGKRNSTINLLSGGEKALTAVALVFAIFELNPSPFCMLDEVDAPLDDTNVNRFCEIVKDMSAKVQFIFITHNKATMELARQLSGVTMQEPGVSRLVSVDLDEAVKMSVD
jgi:chromosome segregation protein